MFKWLLGRWITSDFKRDLNHAKDVWDLDEARSACVFLLERTATVKLADQADDPNTPLASTLNEIRDNTALMNTAWYHRSHPTTISRIVLDDWLTARHAVLSDAIHFHVLSSIEFELSQFIASRLKPQEIKDVESYVRLPPPSTSVEQSRPLLHGSGIMPLRGAARVKSPGTHSSCE